MKTMKYNCASCIILFLLIGSAHSQVISADALQIFYYDIMNPISFAVPNVSQVRVQIECKHGEILKRDEHYYYYVKRVIDDDVNKTSWYNSKNQMYDTLTLFSIENNDSILYTTRIFNLFFIHKPVVKMGAVSQGIKSQR